MARTKSRPVTFSDADRTWLTIRIRTGTFPAQQVRRARILLELDEDHPGRLALGEPVPTQVKVAELAGVCADTVVKVSRAYAERGGDVEETVTRKKRLTPPVEAKVTGEVEARLIALACSQPPEGHARWSLRLLEKHVLLTEGLLTEGLPPVDHSTIGRVLKKRNFSLI